MLIQHLKTYTTTITLTSDAQISAGLKTENRAFALREVHFGAYNVDGLQNNQAQPLVFVNGQEHASSSMALFNHPVYAGPVILKEEYVLAPNTDMVFTAKGIDSLTYPIVVTITLIGYEK